MFFSHFSKIINKSVINKWLKNLIFALFRTFFEALFTPFNTFINIYALMNLFKLLTLYNLLMLSYNKFRGNTYGEN